MNKDVDVIVVGLGLAGVAMCYHLEKMGKSYIVIDNNSQTSSHIAGGVYNPVILKRFTPVWDAQSQLEYALQQYEFLEKELKITFDFKFDTLRLFASVEEQNNWFIAADKPLLKPFLDTDLVLSLHPDIPSPYAFGRVKETGKLDTHKFLEAFKAKLLENHSFIDNDFDYNALSLNKEGLNYKDLKAKHVIFCQGYGLKDNPYFKDLPLMGTKGEVLTIKVKGLNLKAQIKSSVFILPLGNDLYKVGATFNWNDKTNLPTEKAREELISKLDNILLASYEIVDHQAGIRPTVIDRRPLVGKHKSYPQLLVLNGLGTRGVMIAPMMAKKLVNHLYNDAELDPEIDLNRFEY